MAGESEELLDLIEQASGSKAAAAASGIGGLTAAMDALRVAMIASGQAAQQAGQGFTSTTTSAKAASGSMGGFKDACTSAATAITKVGSVAASLAGGAIPSATAAFTEAGQVIGGAVSGACDKAAQALSKLGPEGAAAGAAIEGLGVIASATVGTLMTLVGIAVDVSEKMGLMTARMAAFAGSAAGGAAVQAMVGKLAASLPFATSQINDWTQTLLKAGVAGKDLELAVKAAASAEALGEGGGAAMTALIGKLTAGGKEAATFVKQLHEGGGRAQKMLREMGLTMADLGGRAAVAKMSAAELAKAIEKAMVKKGAGPLEEMAGSFPAILQKAQEGFRSLFSGLGPAVKPFMKAIKELFGEFNKGGGATKGLKPLVTGFLTTVISWATKAVKVLREIVKAFSGTGKPGMITTLVNGLKMIFGNAMVLKGIKAIFTVIAVVIGVVIGVVGALVGVFAVVAAGVMAAVGVIADGVSTLWSSISGSVDGAIAALMGLPAGAMEAASNFIAGLVGGIQAGAGAIIAAVTGLASGALSAFKGALGIKSPSKVMLEHGEKNIAGAAATGVDKGTDKMDASMERLGAPPKGGGKGAGGKSGSGAEYHFHYTGPAEDSGPFFERAAAWLQGLRDEAPEPAS